MKKLILPLALASLCMGAELELPAPQQVKIDRANTPSGAYSGNHTINQAINGSVEGANWHTTGKDEVVGTFEFDTPASFDSAFFENASFNKVELEVQRKGKWEKLGSFDIGGAKLARFKKTVKDVDALRMTVKGDKGFRLRELVLQQKAKNPYAKVCAKVFTDSSCSKLKPEATPADIKALPEFFRSIAKQLKSGKYGTAMDTEFRLGEYKAFSAPEYAAKVRNINALSPLDNPTGIYAEEGEEIIVLVGPTGGQGVSLASVSPHGISFTTYPLEEGPNKVNITRTGLLYVMYHVDPTEGGLKGKKPVRVHIPLGYGKVNGFFDITKHKDADYKRMIAEAPAPMFDLVGRESMMILDTRYLKQYSPDGIEESVNVWDESVREMWKIMGFDKYPKPHNNRQLGVAMDGGAHMFATWYYCGYSMGNNGNTMKNEVLAPGVLRGKTLWGIGHEIGHCYQHPMNWRSMTESCNNFFAQLILDKVVQPRTGNEAATDMENPCKYLLEDACKGKPFHDFNGWAKWGFAQYSFYLYFHKLGFKEDFYPTLYEDLRKNPLAGDPYNVGPAHLDWYERVCNHAKVDFTEDFEIFNWFTPMDHKGNQYGQYHMLITKEAADAAKARIKAKNYPKPKFRVAFIHQHGKQVNLWGQNLKGSELQGYWKNYTRKDLKLNPACKATKEGELIKVTDGENAAAFCVKTDGKIVGYYDRTQFSTKSCPWNDSSEVYAIPMLTKEPYKLIYKESK